MRGSRRLTVVAFALGVLLALGFGLVAGLTRVEAKGPCRCPQIYAPVTCDNGKTYPNQCVADCRNARNCVPADTF